MSRRLGWSAVLWMMPVDRWHMFRDTTVSVSCPEWFHTYIAFLLATLWVSTPFRTCTAWASTTQNETWQSFDQLYQSRVDKVRGLFMQCVSVLVRLCQFVWSQPLSNEELLAYEYTPNDMLNETMLTLDVTFFVYQIITVVYVLLFGVKITFIV